MDIQRVGVGGTGMMGPGIAAVFALSGRTVTLVSRSGDGAERGLASARALLARLTAAGLADGAAAEEAQGRLASSTDLAATARASDLFVESIAESLPLKQDYFEALGAAAPDAILCSNTSGLSITEIAAKTPRPERVLTTHFWNPPHLMPLVEVVAGRRTDPEIARQVVQLLERCGKSPVLVHLDRPGQLGNRIQHAMVRECLHIVEEGIASPEDVDRAVTSGFGLRLPVYGVFEHADLVGLDLVEAVQDIVLPDLSTAQGATAQLRSKLARGEVGARSGKGFLEWPPGKADAVRKRRDDFLVEFLRMRRADRHG